MEVWFIFAILSAITAGLYHFILKVAAEKEHNSSHVNYYGVLFGILFSIIYLLYDFNLRGALISVILGTLGGLFYTISSISRIDALKNIHTTLYYPLYKTGTAFFVVFISFLIFRESMTLIQAIGVIIGLAVFFILMEKEEERRQKNLKKGYFLLFIGILFTALTVLVDKTVSVNDISFPLFFLSTYVISSLYSFYNYKKTKEKTKSKNNAVFYGIGYGVLTIITYIFFLNALKGGNLLVVYTINSMSITIPILLSVKVYKDHFDYKKALVLVLAILSVILLK